MRPFQRAACRFVPSVAPAQPIRSANLGAHGRASLALDRSRRAVGWVEMGTAISYMWLTVCRKEVGINLGNHPPQPVGAGPAFHANAFNYHAVHQMQKPGVLMVSIS